jgi:hypothetical protein
LFNPRPGTCGEEVDDLLRRAGFPETGENPGEAIGVGVLIHIGHGVGGERDVEAEFIGVAGGRFDAEAGGDAAEHNLCHALASQVIFKVGAGKRTPGSFGHKMILGLPIQFGQQVRPVGREITEASCLFRAPRGRHQRH